VGAGQGLVGLTCGRAEWPCRAAANTLHAQRGEGKGDTPVSWLHGQWAGECQGQGEV
jgi:hypothetical protein